MSRPSLTPSGASHAPAGPARRVRRRARRLLATSLVTSSLAIVGSMLLPGCVVTTAPTFTDQPDCPPSFVPSEASPPINHPVQIDATDPSAKFVATVPLRSCAVTKTYDSHYFLDGQVFPNKIDPNGTDTRSTTITVPFLNVAPGCHRIELLATTAFMAGDLRTPQTQGDLAYIVWFIDVINGPSGASSTLASCPQ